MMRIFISYRREDSGASAGRLYDRLREHFGRDNIFMDIDTIKPGLDFTEVIERVVASCDVLIALIGRQWLTSTDAAGQPRLNNPEDFVRQEIATALRRNIRVIPVLVQDAPMPRAADLPDDLKRLSRRHALELSDVRFHRDVDQLIEVLDRVLGGYLEMPREEPTGFPREMPERANYVRISVAGKLKNWLIMARERLSGLASPPTPPAGTGPSPVQYRTSRGNFDAALPTARDLVDCTVFTRQKVALGEQVLIQVFIHMPEDAEELDTVAKAADPKAMRRGAIALSTEIARGSRLMFALNIPRVVIDKPVQEIIWYGTKTSVQFLVTAPKKLLSALAAASRPLSLVATVSVSQDGVVIGQIKFVLQIERTGSDPNNPQIIGEAHRYHTAFISYASENRPDVLRCVQMLRVVGITYFHDLLSLDPGQRWAQQLYRHIDASDVLFLFWSTPAKQSKWVTKEWRYGLKQKGLDFIKPVIIEGPPPVPPPRALARLHFNDWLPYVIRAEEAARSDSSKGHGKL